MYPLGQEYTLLALFLKGETRYYESATSLLAMLALSEFFDETLSQ